MDIYWNIYNLILDYIYAGQPDMYGEYVATFVSTVACVFLLALPFIVVWRIIRVFL